MKCRRQRELSCFLLVLSLVLYPSVFFFDPRVIQGSYIKEETGQNLCIKGLVVDVTQPGREQRQGKGCAIPTTWNWEQEQEKNAAWGGVFIPVSASQTPTPCTAAPLPALMVAPSRAPPSARAPLQVRKTALLHLN